MREIKFRAWNPQQKRMVFGARGDEVNASWVLAMCSANDMEPMQYTGLKDKNGKEIYEGDILQNPKVKDIGPVEWDDFDIGPAFHWCHPKMYSCPMDECEVIGNIYENPELLER
jgi:hypothetical protein